ncbi:MAG: hypothetical protein LBM77_05950 [Spirochaetaceae bacterium]|nr:hypothetical protein [Spirochaetaceae bacterium]
MRTVSAFFLFCLLGALPLGAQDSDSFNTELPIALYPLVIKALPPGESEATIRQVVHSALIENVSGQFYLIAETTELEDPALYPDSGDSSTLYSITLELFYDDTKNETQIQTWLWDNEAGELVVKDQFAYQDYALALRFFPVLVHTILDRIPRYELRFKIKGDGRITMNGDPVMPVRAIGPKNIIILSATAETGERFLGWTITGPDQNGEIQSISLTENPYILQLNNDNYFTRHTDAYDMFGTTRTIEVAAEFTGDGKIPEKIPAEETNPVIVIPTRASVHYYEPQFKLSAAYAPLAVLTEDNSLAPKGMYPLGFAAALEWLPFQNPWGNIGLGLNYNYLSIKSNLEKYYTKTQFHTANIALFYESALFWNLVRFTGGLEFGFGIPTLSADYWLNNTQETKPSFDMNLTLAFSADIYVLYSLYISPQIKAAWYFPSANYVVLKPGLAIGIRF